MQYKDVCRVLIYIILNLHDGSQILCNPETLPETLRDSESVAKSLWRCVTTQHVPEPKRFSWCVEDVDEDPEPRRKKRRTNDISHMTASGHIDIMALASVAAVM